MGKEIERKFLVKGSGYKDHSIKAIEIAQGYLSYAPEATVRVRISDRHGFLTVKGKNRGVERGEWEYEIPLNDARELIDSLCGGKTISKTRFIVPYNGLTWEVDEFHGRLEGLVVAEVEIPSVDFDITPLPAFAGNEVTGDPRYYNSRLIDSDYPL